MEVTSYYRQLSFISSPKYRKQFLRSNILSHVFLFLGATTYVWVTASQYQTLLSFDHLIFTVTHTVLVLLTFMIMQILYLPFFEEKVMRERELLVQEWKLKMRNPRRDQHGEIIRNY